jgi:hypothetical protein
LMTSVNRLLFKWQEQLFPFFKLSSQHILQIMSHHKCSQLNLEIFAHCFMIVCPCFHFAYLCISHTLVAYKFHHFQHSHITYSKGRMKLPLNPCVPPSILCHPSGRPCGSTPWKLRGCRLHTIPLLSLTLQLSAHQEWEGNKPGMK